MKHQFHLVALIFIIAGIVVPVRAARTASDFAAPMIPGANLDQLKEIAVLGRGTPLTLDGIPNSPYFRIQTTRGLYVYDTSPTPHFYNAIDTLPTAYQLPTYPAPAYTVTIGGNPTIRYKQGNTRVLAKPIVASQDLRFVLFSPDQRLAVWNIARSGLEGRILEGNRDRIVAANFSPDATQVVAASADGEIHLWDVANGKHRVSFNAPETWVHLIGLVNHNTQVVALDTRGQLWKWDASTGQGGVVDLGYTSAIVDVAFSPDNTTIAASGQSGAYLWQLPTGNIRSLRLLNATGKPGLHFSADGELLFMQATNGLGIWEVATGRLRQRWVVGDDFYGMRKSFSTSSTPDLLAVLNFGITDLTSPQNTLFLIEPKTNHIIATIPTTFKYLNMVAFSPDGSTLAVVGGHDFGYVGNEDQVQFYNVQTQQPIGSPMVTGLAKPHLLWYLTDGRLIAAIGRLKAVFIAPDKTIRPAFEANCATYNEGVNPVQSAQSPDTHLLVFKGVEGCAQPQVYEVDGSIKPLKVATVDTTSFAFSSDGRLFAIGDAQGLVHVFQVSL